MVLRYQPTQVLGTNLAYCAISYALAMRCPVLTERMLLPGSLPPMAPAVVGSRNALDCLTIMKSCVDGRKKDRVMLQTDLELVGR
eukprot:202533-Rhodomonas_salina.2